MSSSQFVPLSDFHRLVQQWKSSLADYEGVDTRSMGFDADAEGEALSARFQGSVPGAVGVKMEDRLPVEEQGLEQISERLDGPPMKWFLGKCSTPLQADVMNSLIRFRENKSLLLRAREGKIRAALSDKYIRFDHGEFVDLIVEAFQSEGLEPQVKRGDLGDEMRAYVLLPEITFAQDPALRGDPPHGNGGLHPGAYISNSEIGTGAARIAGGLFRGICSNGAIYGWNAGAALIVRHVHTTHSKILLEVSEGIVGALKMSEEAASKFIEAQVVRLPRTKISSLVSHWSGAYGISVEAKEDWLRAITQEADTYGRAEIPTLFDMVNGASLSAQHRGAREREMMERMAGDLLGARRAEVEEGLFIPILSREDGIGYLAGEQ